MMNCLFRGAALVGATLVAVSVHAGEPAQETLLWLGPWETQAAPSAKEGPLPEPADCLAHTLKMGQANTSWHGATISEMSVWDYPLFKPFLDMFASRTMRSYRAYGLNGGLMNFNVADGYGKPNPNDNQPIQGYGGLEVLDHRPLWANGYYDVLQRNNHDFVGFIGGADGPYRPDSCLSARRGGPQGGGVHLGRGGRSRRAGRMAVHDPDRRAAVRDHGRDGGLSAGGFRRARTSSARRRRSRPPTERDSRRSTTISASSRATSPNRRRGRFIW